MLTITVPDDSYYEILQVIGYPVVGEDDLEFTRQDIESLFILPAVREYYTWWPITEKQSSVVGANFEIAFPDAYTFGVVDARLSTQSYSAGTKTASPFMNSVLFSRQRTRSYGTKYDYGLSSSRIYEKVESESIIDNQKAVQISVDRENGVVTGQSNMTGELIITWAKFSTDFGTIPMRRYNEVIKLSQANVLRGFAMLRGQMNTDTGPQFNYSEFTQRADNLEESIMETWRTRTKPVILRG